MWGQHAAISRCSCCPECRRSNPRSLIPQTPPNPPPEPDALRFSCGALSGGRPAAGPAGQVGAAAHHARTKKGSPRTPLQKKPSRARSDRPAGDPTNPDRRERPAEPAAARRPTSGTDQRDPPPPVQRELPAEPAAARRRPPSDQRDPPRGTGSSATPPLQHRVCAAAACFFHFLAGF